MNARIAETFLVDENPQISPKRSLWPPQAAVGAGICARQGTLPALLRAPREHRALSSASSGKQQQQLEMESNFLGKIGTKWDVAAVRMGSHPVSTRWAL